MTRQGFSKIPLQIRSYMTRKYTIIPVNILSFRRFYNVFFKRKIIICDRFVFFSCLRRISSYPEPQNPSDFIFKLENIRQIVMSVHNNITFWRFHEDFVLGTFVYDVIIWTSTHILWLNPPLLPIREKQGGVNHRFGRRPKKIPPAAGFYSK